MLALFLKSIFHIYAKYAMSGVFFVTFSSIFEHAEAPTIVPIGIAIANITAVLHVWWLRALLSLF